METPSGPAGKATERVMAVVRQQVASLEGSSYNRVYEAVLQELQAAYDALAASRGTAPFRG